MKRYSILLLLIILGISSCEKDDFCINPKLTPKLVLRFYDKNVNTDLKKVKHFSIIAQGKTDSIFTNKTTDSIAIPLNSLVNKTVYTLKRNMINGNIINNEITTLTIQYKTEENFVSRSCGFRVIFKEVTINTSNGWINNLSTTAIDLIDNQNLAHVQVFH